MEKRNKGKHVARRKPLSGGAKAAIICAVVVAVIAATGGTLCGIFHHYYSLMGDSGTEDPSDKYWIDPNESDETEPNEPFDPSAPTNPPTPPEEQDKIEQELLDHLKYLEENSDLYNTDAFNIMIIGVDSRKDSFAGRSDCMILVSINKSTKKVVMASFLRDIYCSIPGYGNNRLNAAYANGGAELLKKTIKANFGITVDRCVVVNFYLVMDAVNAVGGIDLDLTAAEIGWMNEYIYSQNELIGQASDADMLPRQDGTYHVNGNQALAYARVRYIGTDFARTNRQRTVILKCLEKIKGMSLGGLTDLAEQFLPKVRTDLTEGDCASLLTMLLSISDFEVENMAIPVDGTWNFATIRDMDVITLDFNANSVAWHEKVEG